MKVLHKIVIGQVLPVLVHVDPVIPTRDYVHVVWSLLVCCCCCTRMTVVGKPYRLDRSPPMTTASDKSSFLDVWPSYGRASVRIVVRYHVLTKLVGQAMSWLWLCRRTGWQFTPVQCSTDMIFRLWAAGY